MPLFCLICTTISNKPCILDEYQKTNFEWAGVDTSGRVRHPPYSKKLFVWPYQYQKIAYHKMPLPINISRSHSLQKIATPINITRFHITRSHTQSISEDPTPYDQYHKIALPMNIKRSHIRRSHTTIHICEFVTHRCPYSCHIDIRSHTRMNITRSHRTCFAVCHDSFTRVPWLLHKCAMTSSHVCHDSFTRVPWLLHTCAMTPTHVCHDSFTRVPWLLHRCA